MGHTNKLPNPLVFNSWEVLAGDQRRKSRLGSEFLLLPPCGVGRGYGSVGQLCLWVPVTTPKVQQQIRSYPHTPEHRPRSCPLGLLGVALKDWALTVFPFLPFALFPVAWKQDSWTAGQLDSWSSSSCSGAQGGLEDRCDTAETVEWKAGGVGDILDVTNSGPPTSRHCYVMKKRC